MLSKTPNCDSFLFQQFFRKKFSKIIPKSLCIKVPTQYRQKPLMKYKNLSNFIESAVKLHYCPHAKSQTYLFWRKTTYANQRPPTTNQSYIE